MHPKPLSLFSGYTQVSWCQTSIFLPTVFIMDKEPCGSCQTALLTHFIFQNGIRSFFFLCGILEEQEQHGQRNKFDVSTTSRPAGNKNTLVPPTQKQQCSEANPPPPPSFWRCLFTTLFAQHKQRKEAEMTESFYLMFPIPMGSSAFPAFHSTHPRTKDKLFFCI